MGGGTCEAIGDRGALARVSPEVGRHRAGSGAHPEERQAGSDRLVDPGTRLQHPAAEDRIRRPAHHRVRDLLVVEHGAAATRAANDVDAVARARLEIHIVERLHPPEAQARGREPVETHGARDLAASASIEQRQVATHVLLARRGSVDEQLETPIADALTATSDIEAHVDDVAIAHHVVATLEPLLPALAQHRV